MLQLRVEGKDIDEFGTTKSGHWGHRGIPQHRGGSLPNDAGGSDFSIKVSDRLSPSEFSKEDADAMVNSVKTTLGELGEDWSKELRLVLIEDTQDMTGKPEAGRAFLSIGQYTNGAIIIHPTNVIKAFSHQLPIKEAFRRVFTHELAHHYYTTHESGYSSFSITPFAIIWGGIHTKASNGGKHPTMHSLDSPSEYFSAAFEQYILNQKDNIEPQAWGWFEKNVGRKKFMESVLEFGTSRSGYWKHHGRPGQRGGSARNDEPELTRVGITSYSTGRKYTSVHAVYRDMETFKGKLKSIDGVSGVSVKFGTGVWEGGREPSWVVSYKGNGQALSLIAQTAKDKGQDGVLILRAPLEGNAHPIIEMEFEERVRPDNKKAILNTVTSEGLGLTWYTKGGKQILFVSIVPEFGNRDEQMKMVSDKIRKALGDLKLKASVHEGTVSTTVLGPDTYDKYIHESIPSEGEAVLAVFFNIKKKAESGTARSGHWKHAGIPGHRGGSAPGAVGVVPSRSHVKVAPPDVVKNYPEYRGRFITKTELNRLRQGIPESVQGRMLIGTDPEWDALVQSNPLVIFGPTPIDDPKGIINPNPKDRAKREGRCYEMAARFAMKNDGWDVYHATLYPRTGKFEDYPYFHGFAVKGEVVYDAVIGKFYDKHDYFRYFTPTDIRIYTHPQMFKLMVKTKSWGSWE